MGIEVNLYLNFEKKLNGFIFMIFQDMTSFSYKKIKHLTRVNQRVDS